jgi:hypothetical protein
MVDDSVVVDLRIEEQYAMSRHKATRERQLSLLITMYGEQAVARAIALGGAAGKEYLASLPEQIQWASC